MLEFINVIIAGVASFAFGAVWYMSLAEPWKAASGIAVDENGDPLNQSDPVPYITSFVASLLVAGMMRHAFVTGGVETFWAGLVSGFGVGAFLVSPWIATFYAFNSKPLLLVAIDCGYAIIGCTIIGAVLMLF
ncbi:MAG: DUF1761 domain-containing protein [Pseudomonadota bacterium]